MPDIHVYLEKELYEKVIEESKQELNLRDRPSPSRVIQKALKKHYKLRD